MHKVTYGPNENKVYEYKEICQKITCVKGRNTNWTYSDSFVKPCCKFCQGLLKGKDLTNLQATRILYQLED